MSDENSVRAEKLFDKLRALISKNLSDDLSEDDDETMKTWCALLLKF